VESSGTSISFRTTVRKVEFKRRMRRSWKQGDEVLSDWEDLGWFILLEGSWEYLYVGRTEPPFKPHDTVTVVITRNT
jgi:hypothetical protein